MGTAAVSALMMVGGRLSAGSEARIELAEPIEGRRRFRGRLGPVEDGLVMIEVDGREWKLPLSGISKARLVG